MSNTERILCYLIVASTLICTHLFANHTEQYASLTDNELSDYFNDFESVNYKGDIHLVGLYTGDGFNKINIIKPKQKQDNKHQNNIRMATISPSDYGLNNKHNYTLESLVANNEALMFFLKDETDGHLYFLRAGNGSYDFTLTKLPEEVEQSYPDLVKLNDK